MPLFLALLQVVMAQEAPSQGISGQVLNAADGQPLVDFWVMAGDAEARTDAEGRFHLDVRPGEYEVTVFGPEFESLTLPGRTGQELTFELFASEEEVLVIEGLKSKETTSVLLEERQEAVGVTDAIGAEQIRRSGDSNAAGAMKRVTGLSVVDGRYVYVRGLGERYSATTLNGSTLPSPEPERRVVPLDLLPTGLLSSVVVQKTAEANLPGEFGGGLLSLRTKDVPDRPFARMTLSTGAQWGSTFQKSIAGSAGPTDFLGIDGGHRDLPDSIVQASADQPLAEGDMFSDRGYSASELEEFGEAIPNRWKMKERMALPDMGLSLALGNRYNLGDTRLGLIGGLSYDTSWDVDEVDRNYFIVGANGALEPSHSYHFEESTHRVRLGGLLGTSLRIGESHDLDWVSLVARQTDDEARIYEGYNRDLDGDIRVSRLRWVERMLQFHQLRGTHRAGPAEVSWRYALSNASRGEPDQREWRQDKEASTGAWRLSDRPEGNQILYSGLSDWNHDAGLDVASKLREGKVSLTVRGGLAFTAKNRSVDTRRYKFESKGSMAGRPDVSAMDPSEAFTPDYIDPDGFQLSETTRQTDNYSALQRIGAAWTSFDVGLNEKWRFVAGARVEQSVQQVDTFELFNPDQEPVVAESQTTDFLPSTAVTWNFRDDMLVRVGYARSLNRPDFRELSPATFNDVTGGRETYGNPDLERAILDNVDLRWEWYPSDEESVSFGAFYKHFQDPIEEIVVVSAAHSITYENALGADNVGVEVEFRKSIPWVSGLYAAGNLAVIHSQIHLDEGGIQTDSDRPLQGQSPYLTNLEIGMDRDRWDVALFWNLSGPRITEVGAVGAPNVVEQPVASLDAMVGFGLGHGLSFTMRGKNLIDPVHRLTQGEETVESFREGWGIGLGLAWTPLE